MTTIRPYITRRSGVAGFVLLLAAILLVGARDGARAQDAGTTPTAAATATATATATVAADTADAEFGVGDAVEVAEGPLNLREGAGTDEDVVTALEVGAALTITDGPTSADNEDWYEVETADGDEGWVAGQYLSVPTGEDTEYATGDQVVVTDGPVNVRAEPGLDADIVDELEAGAVLDVLGGPLSVDDYAWYEIDAGDEVTGWVASAFLALNDGSTPDDGAVSGDYAIGDAVQVAIEPTNLREAAGLDAAVIATLDQGTALEVLDGPTALDEWTWYQVTDGELTGWMIGEGLDPADGGSDDGTDDGSGAAADYAIGDAVQVAIEPTNLRDDASLDGEVIDVLDQGTALEITDGPVAADGWTWFLVTDGGDITGWIIGEGLDPAGTDSGASFGVGDTVLATIDDLNFRADAGLDAEILDTLPIDTPLLIEDGPVAADDFTWYQVSNEDYGTGWVADELVAYEASGE